MSHGRHVGDAAVELRAAARLVQDGRDAVVGRVAAGQEPQERRLSRAVGPEHGAPAAARDAERDALERRDRLGERHAARDVDAVAEVDVAGDDGHPARALTFRACAAS